MTEESASILLMTADPLVVRRIRSMAEAAEIPVFDTKGLMSGQPGVVVVDLEQPGAVDEVASLRVIYPDAVLVGHLSRPEKERWLNAERAGCDLVANRGAVVRQLKKTLENELGRRKFPLMDEADVAGRLGLAARVEESPFGPLAVYQVDGRITVIDDVCPHAGERLSGGEVTGCIVTCPRHGSQFDVQTGERVRGPADKEVGSHEVIRAGGRVHLVWTGSAEP